MVIEQVSYVLDYAEPVTVDSTDWGFQEICHVAEDMSAIETAQLDMEEKLDYGTVNVTVTPDGASASVTYKPLPTLGTAWTLSMCSVEMILAS